MAKIGYTHQEKRKRNLRILEFMNKHPTWRQTSVAKQFRISQPMLSKILKRLNHNSILQERE